MKCRLCNNDKSIIKRAEFVFGGKEEHKFWECSNCGVIFLYPYLSEEEEKYFYNKEFEKFMSSRSGNERDWTNAKKHIDTNQDQVERRLKYLKKHLRSNMKILEIGCSSGFMMKAFKEIGAECVGIEPSGEFLPFLKNGGFRAYENLEKFIKENPDEKFDLVVHFFVFEHISEPFSFLENTYNLLKPNGMIIAEIPSSTDVLTSVYNIPAFEKFYWSIAHHYYYNPKSIEFIMKKLGYRYIIQPEQRYDLSNHITWLMDGKPGGQGRFDMFCQETIDSYGEDLKKSWKCDTLLLSIFKDLQ